MTKTQENLNPESSKYQSASSNSEYERLAERLAPISKAYRIRQKLFHDLFFDKCRALSISQSELPIFSYFYSLRHYGGHDRKFIIKKAQNMALKAVIERNDNLLSNPQIERWDMCARVLEFNLEAQTVIEEIDRCDSDKITDLLKDGAFKKLLKGMKKNLVDSWFCSTRGCPVCDWRSSLVSAMDLEKIVLKFIEESGYDYEAEQGRKFPIVMFTGTVPNVTADKLPDAIDQVLAAVKFMNNKVFNPSRKDSYLDWKFVLGSCRKIEITYNKKDDTYHPHIHWLWALHEDYYTSRFYKKAEDFSEIWAKKAGGEIIDIRTAKAKDFDPKKGVEHQVRAIAREVAKYATKASDFFEDDDYLEPVKQGEVWVNIKKALKGRQIIAYSLRLNEIRKELKIDQRTKKEEVRLMMMADRHEKIINSSHTVSLRYDHENFDFRNY